MTRPEWEKETALVFALIGAGNVSLDALIGFSPLNPVWLQVGALLLALLGLLVWQPTLSWVQKRWHAFQP